ncbi:MAG: hypothetical protein O3C45_10870 [Bacteroidetes bacterium]|nr:hypothetical protein [Bacteroidota bacterium]MDA0875546.1 hypothetical protein [Bacteroidota bacterium]
MIRPDLRHLGALGCLMLTFVSSFPAAGQSEVRPERLAVGLLVGPVSGLGLKATYVEPQEGLTGRSIDGALSFNLEGYVYSSVHILQERLLSDSPLRVVIGPGMVSEFDDDSVRWGMSGMVGTYFLRGPYEVLIQLQPRLYVTPEWDGSFGAAVGLRYRF